MHGGAKSGQQHSSEDQNCAAYTPEVQRTHNWRSTAWIDMNASYAWSMVREATGTSTVASGGAGSIKLRWLDKDYARCLDARTVYAAPNRLDASPRACDPRRALLRCTRLPAGRPLSSDATGENRCLTTALEMP